jgi:hypothetical protein
MGPHIEVQGLAFFYSVRSGFNSRPVTNTQSFLYGQGRSVHVNHASRRKIKNFIKCHYAY